MSPIFVGPLDAGYIKYSELFQPGLGLDDILDMNEILMVKNENDFRAMEAAKKK